MAPAAAAGQRAVPLTFRTGACPRVPPEEAHQRPPGPKTCRGAPLLKHAQFLQPTLSHALSASMPATTPARSPSQGLSYSSLQDRGHPRGAITHSLQTALLQRSSSNTSNQQSQLQQYTCSLCPIFRLQMAVVTSLVTPRARR